MLESDSSAMNDLRPIVNSFFDQQTNSFSYVVYCPNTLAAAVIDSVLNFDYAGARTSTQLADEIIAFVRAHDLHIEWILETHIHADHLTAAPYLQEQLGGKTAIGQAITQVQETFAPIFDVEEGFPLDGSQFNCLLADGATFFIGDIPVEVIHTPGHTPACMSYLIGDAVFVGDTLFMPDYGTARCDFPGGDAALLYQSVQKFYALGDTTRMFLCHDYLPATRQEYQCETTVGAQRQSNIHIHEGVSQEAYVRLRNTRDATLAMPRLIIPSVQINLRAGKLPPAAANKILYLKTPLNTL